MATRVSTQKRDAYHEDADTGFQIQRLEQRDAARQRVTT